MKKSSRIQTRYAVSYSIDGEDGKMTLELPGHPDDSGSNYRKAVSAIRKATGSSRRADIVVYDAEARVYDCHYHANAFFNTKRAARSEERAMVRAGAYDADCYPVEDGWSVDITVQIEVPIPEKGEECDLDYLERFFAEWREEKELGHWWSLSHVENYTTGENFSN